LIVFDHSPTALLAARGFAARRVLIGSGFCAPPDLTPLPNLRSWAPKDPQQLVRDEETVLARINRLMRVRELPALQRIGQLYSDVDENFLLTLRELDHYPQRSGAVYWGSWPAPGGQPPRWPSGSGKRIFAYLKNVPALAKLLEHLAQLKHPTIVCGDGINPELQKRLACPTLCFEARPLDLKQVGEECDLAISNAGHNTSVALLLRGKPLLLLPIFLEQGICARAVSKLGMGMDISCKNAAQAIAGINVMLSSSRFGEAARQFAARYADFDPQRQVEKMRTRLEELLSTGPAG